MATLLPWEQAAAAQKKKSPMPWELAAASAKEEGLMPWEQAAARASSEQVEPEKEETFGRGFVMNEEYGSMNVMLLR